METPFSTADLERIKANLAEIDDAERLADLAVRAGFDMNEQLERLREAKAQLVRIRSVFFPNQ